MTNVTKRYRVKDGSLCDCCKENQAIWYERPCNNDIKYFMCLICMKDHYTQEGAKVEFHEEDTYNEEDIIQDEDPYYGDEFQINEENNDTDNYDSDPEEDSGKEGKITDHFTIGSFTIFEVKESKWEFAKGICSLGGCYTDIVSFTNLKEAIYEAQRLTNEGIEPKIGYPCSSCMRDY